MSKETKQERLIRLFGETAAEAEAENAPGLPAAFARALVRAIQEALIAGYRITDLDCFRLDPRYTGGGPKFELPPEVIAALEAKGFFLPDSKTLTQELIADELKNTMLGELEKKPQNGAARG